MAKTKKLKKPTEVKGFHGQLTPTRHSQRHILESKRIKTITTIKVKKTGLTIFSPQKIKSETRVE